MATSNGASSGPHYFSALRVPLLKGRFFDQRDTANSARVLIVNEAFAKKFWDKGGDPIGQQVTIGKGLGPEFEDPAREIVGVVGNVRETGLNSQDLAAMYVPQPQVSDGLTKLANSVIPLCWVVQTSGDPSALSAAIQHEIQSVDNQLSASKVRSMDQVMADSTARQNFNMLLLTIFAGLALLLAAIGIYGLDVVHRGATHAGNRDSHGAGGGSQRYVETRRAPGHALGWNRRREWGWPRLSA